MRILYEQQFFVFESEFIFIGAAFGCNRTSFGLMYGIPKFIPRSIKSIPMRIITKGIILFISVFSLAETIFPAIESKSSKGNVPNPKINIKTDPPITLPVAIAPANAIYTNPQGNKPLSKPIINKDE